MLLISFIVSLAASGEVELPETKSLRGGIFGWFDALKGQRKFWSNSKTLPMITLYDGDPDMTGLINKVIDSKVKFNITQTIESLFKQLNLGGGSTSNSDNNNNNNNNNGGVDGANAGVAMFATKDHNKNGAKNLLAGSAQGGDGVYKNVDFVNQFFNTDSLGIANEELDKLAGQVLSYASIITMLVVFFVVSLVFFIVFCFGCCCCCCAKKRDCPNVVSIIFFGIAIFLMLFGTISFFIAIADLFKFLDLALVKGKAQALINAAVDGIANSVEGLLNGGITDLLVPTVNGITTNITGFIKGPVYGIVDTINSVFTSITSFSAALDYFSDTFNKTLDDFSKATAAVKQDTDCSKLFEGIDLSSTIPSDTNVGDFIGPIKDTIGSVNQMEQITDITKMLDDILPQLNKVTEYLDFSDESKNLVNKIKEIKTSIDVDDLLKIVHEPLKIPISGKVIRVDIPMAVRGILYLTPVLMLVLTLVFAAVFWTKCCCSRCIASCACCQPCCCNFCMLIMGIFGTLLGFIFIFLINTIIDEGDKAVNHLVDNLLVDRKLQIPEFKMNVGGVNFNLKFKAVEIGPVNLFKGLFESKKNTPLTEFFPITKLIPFDQIGGLVSDAVTDLVSSFDISSITRLITDALDQININGTIPDSMGDLFNTGDGNLTEQMTEQINNITSINGTSISSKCIDMVSDLMTATQGISQGINNMITPIDNALQTLTGVLNNGVIRDQVNGFSNGIVGVLFKVGQGLGDAITQIPTILNRFEPEPIIGTFNILKTTILYNVVHSMVCMSISAHLFMVGTFMMVLLLWIRRRGMAKEDGSDRSGSSYSYSTYSFSSSDGKHHNHRRRSSKRIHANGSDSGSDNYNGGGRVGRNDYQDRNVDIKDDADLKEKANEYSDSSSYYSKRSKKPSKNKRSSSESYSSDDEGKQGGQDAYVF